MAELATQEGPERIELDLVVGGVGEETVDVSIERLLQGNDLVRWSFLLTLFEPKTSFPANESANSGLLLELYPTAPKENPGLWAL
jgi:hypothetical protein